ncbi:MAG: hypothetical protein SFU83_07955 [Meiothermus sp.]|nr:hypothetical protein [Meiothermus sp.]
MGNIEFGGWKVVLPLLGLEGRRWVVSPWVRGAAVELPLGPGDRLLIRGDPADFGAATDPEVLDHFLARGVEVRCARDLHAKLYLVETAAGPFGWVGSANATTGGERLNIELMAGACQFSRHSGPKATTPGPAGVPAAIGAAARQPQAEHRRVTSAVG